MKVSQWRKASYSADPADYGQHCVESRTAGSGFQIRDSKLGDDSPIFTVPATAYAALLASAART